MIVVDPSVQMLGKDAIYAYSVQRNVMRQFDPNDIRAKAQTVHGPDREAAIAAYENWNRSNAESFLSTEPERLRAENLRVSAEVDRIRNRHREFLVKLGIDPESVETRQAQPRHHRDTHCYRCKQHLDNAVFIECGKCNWIICSCGACGCGYGSR